MNQIDTHIIGTLNLSDEQLEHAQKCYEVIEPIMADYTTPEEKQKLRQDAQIALGIKERTLRKYIQNYRENGITGLVRKVRNDKGNGRLYDPKLTQAALDLLHENPYRSIPDVYAMLSQNSKFKCAVQAVTPSTLYHHLSKAGYSFKQNRRHTTQNSYVQFEANYINQLWQGDARHGIMLEHPHKKGKQKRTYLFAWVDDYSRKILYAKYYWDEKLPSLEECLRQAILKWGVPEKLYVDNGSAYVSKQFNIIVNNIGIRKIHHPPYQAWCKGKVERIMKKLKKFQREAELAGIMTIYELNEFLWAWIENNHNERIHDTTGETPNNRFRNNAQKYQPKRITNLTSFNSCFLYRESRVVSKHGFISLDKNKYRITDIGCGETIQIYFNPFKMQTVHIYYHNKYHSSVTAYTVGSDIYTKLPEEKKTSEAKVSHSARAYLETQLKINLERKKNNHSDNFSNIIKEENNDQ